MATIPCGKDQTFVLVDRPKFKIGDVVTHVGSTVSFIVEDVEFMEMKYTGAWAWYVYTHGSAGGFESNFVLDSDAKGGGH